MDSKQPCLGYERGRRRLGYKGRTPPGPAPVFGSQPQHGRGKAPSSRPASCWTCAQVRARPGSQQFKAKGPSCDAGGAERAVQNGGAARSLASALGPARVLASDTSKGRRRAMKRPAVSQPKRRREKAAWMPGGGLLLDLRRFFGSRPTAAVDDLPLDIFGLCNGGCSGVKRPLSRHGRRRPPAQRVWLGKAGGVSARDTARWADSSFVALQRDPAFGL